MAGEVLFFRKPESHPHGSRERRQRASSHWLIARGLVATRGNVRKVDARLFPGGEPKESPRKPLPGVISDFMQICRDLEANLPEGVCIIEGDSGYYASHLCFTHSSGFGGEIVFDQGYPYPDEATLNTMRGNKSYRRILLDIMRELNTLWRYYVINASATLEKKTA